MRLIDFLQASKDLTGQTQFYLKKENELLPLSKLSLTSTHCYLYSGASALTKEKSLILPLELKINKLNFKLLLISVNFPFMACNLL